MYNKTFYTSPKKLFVARIETATGLHHIFFFAQTREQPLFSYDVEKNRFVYIGGSLEISPEALEDLANFGAALYDQNIDKP